MKRFDRTRLGVIAGLALMVSSPAGARASFSPALVARPTATSASLAPGKTALAEGAIAYVPANAVGGSRPLLVLLHGAGGRADPFLDRFRALADREGLILLAVQARGSSWDLAPRSDPLGGPLAMKSRPALRFGPDVARVDAALADLFARTAVDPRRMLLLGFSDGASYALSLGLANPQLFAGIVALSPGFVVVPGQLAPSQRIFIAHGRSDRVLPFRVAERDIAGLLVENGLNPRFQAFDGDHRIDDSALEDGLAFALGRETRP